MFLIYKLAILDLVVSQELAERKSKNKRIDSKMFQMLMDSYHSSPIATSTSVGFLGIAAGVVASVNPLVWAAAGTAMILWGITDLLNPGEIND
jgi:predicted phage tail protein